MLIELSVAVVTTAIVLPLGVYLGTIAERARAEARQPVPAHEALAAVYQLPIGGYSSSGRDVADLAPPPVGPAPGARSPQRRTIPAESRRT